MAKRFIDTGLFDDDWFMDLSKDAKLLWVYFITKCDHAGILKLNEKLCKLQTGIKDLNEVIKQLGNRLVTVTEHLFFIPKYIEFQYPGFPNSKVRQQQSAVEILTKYELYNNGKLTVSKQLDNSYVNDTVNDTVNEEPKKIIYSEFYDAEILKSNNDSEYIEIIEVLFGKNNLMKSLDILLKMPTQISYEQFRKLNYVRNKYKISITQILEKMQNWGNPKKYTTIYTTFQTFAKRQCPEIKEWK